MRVGVRTVGFVALMLAFVLASGCSGDVSQRQDFGEQSGDSGLATMAAPAEGEAIPALSGIGAAEEEAAGWQEDAELYAIAAATPRLDAGGESPSWLYTYVSESAGGVASVAYSGAEGARLEPAQELPEADIEYIARNVLPEASSLTDSTQAIGRTEQVGGALGEDPGIAASAGLDSFSGGCPEWIFATTRGEDRVEERVPAVEGS